MKHTLKVKKKKLFPPIKNNDTNKKCLSIFDKNKNLDVYDI